MHFLKKYLCVIFPPKIIQSISLKSKQNTFAIEMSKCFNFQAHIKLNMPNVNCSHASPPILSTTPHQITKKGGRLVFAFTGSLFITCKKEEQTFKKVIRKKDKNPKLQKFARFISRVIGLTSLPPFPSLLIEKTVVLDSLCLTALPLYTHFLSFGSLFVPITDHF